MANGFQTPAPDNQSSNGLFGDAFGQDTNLNGIKQATVDPNAFQYGGQAGAAQKGGRELPRASPGRRSARAPHKSQSLRRPGRCGQQNYALGQLQDTIAGNGPSVAQQQMQAGLQQAQNQAASTAASARGGGSNLAAAQRMGAEQQGQLAGQQTSKQACSARAGAAERDEPIRRALFADARGNRSASSKRKPRPGSPGCSSMTSARSRTTSRRTLSITRRLNAQMQGQQLDSQNFNNAQNLYYNTASANASRNQSTNQSLFGATTSAIRDLTGVLSDENLKFAVTPEIGGPGAIQAMQAQSNNLATQYSRNASSMSDARNKEAVRSEGMDLEALKRSLDQNGEDRDRFAAAHRRAPAGDMTDAKAAELADEAADMQKRQDAMYAAPVRNNPQPWEDLPGPRQAAPAGADKWDDLHAWAQADAAPARGLAAAPRMSDAKAADMAQIAAAMKADQGAMYSSPTEVGRGAAPARMMEQLQPYSFNYKPGVPGEDPNQRNYGIMAQDLEKSPMGRSLVRGTPSTRQSHRRPQSDQREPRGDRESAPSARSARSRVRVAVAARRQARE